VGAGCGSAAAGGGAKGGFGPVADAGTGGVEVLAQGSTGPFEYVVIRSEDGATLRTWLTNNNYYVSPESAALVDEYVAGQFSFVALRLQRGQDTSAIRPIVLRMSAVEACLPLKLTAIAATPDLRINVWVLAAARAVPINYAEIAINQAKLDWFNAGRNYDQLLREAANEAQGNAFAVEYAKPARDSLTWFMISSNARNELAAAITPLDFMNALSRLALPPTGAVLQILRKHIPLPATLAARGVSESVFYANMYQFWNSGMADFAPFDSKAAAAEMDTEVLMPMADYRALFDRSGRLTRLATFISPEEMTSDPLFVANPSLPDVAPQHLAIAHVMCGDGAQACEAPVRLRTEDGRDVNFRPTACMQYARADDLDRLPAADVAWQRDADGEGRIVVDNRSAIMDALKAHNDAIPVEEAGGCGCAVGGSPGFVVGLMLAAGGLALTLRRRRRR
jgi:MYXO-CTERM domain-containing protein